ncbi:ParA family protein [Fructobacillus tropaeoli]|uniref:ParA family protein n=1 Tax=Fructobacillus tropaeoli TaxID=709323 RepID=UPI002D850D4D|nr:ParA-like ATPase involved in chromosome/plasmid partitioning or cellulose biosynthesis protein BcsQ (ParA) [Fructobacillus tropaeoli]
MSKTITFSASKGGVGKTTMTFNFAAYLVEQGNQVLVIDSDYQGNLSGTYNCYGNEHTLYDVFIPDGNPQILQLSEKLSLLPASPFLDELENILQSKNNKNFLMYMWMQDHAEFLDKFDYILIDTHPEFGTLTKNMIAVSDYVIVPLEPSQYGFMQSKNQFQVRMDAFREDAVDVQSRRSLIRAEVLYLANRVKHNTNTSHQFLSAITAMDGIVATFRELEAFNRSTVQSIPVLELESLQKKPKTRQQIMTNFEKILERVKE